MKGGRRNASQTKARHRAAEEELGVTEASRLPGAELEALPRRVRRDLGAHENREVGNVNTEMQSVRKNQPGMENTAPEIKNASAASRRRWPEAEDRGGDSEDAVENGQSEQNRSIEKIHVFVFYIYICVKAPVGRLRAHRHTRRRRQSNK